MSKIILILDQNNENISFNTSKNMKMLQFKIKGEGLETEANVYLNIKSDNVDFGQTFTITNEYIWKTVYLPNYTTGKITISRPFYNMPPETANGVSVVIEEIRYC